MKQSSNRKAVESQKVQEILDRKYETRQSKQKAIKEILGPGTRRLRKQKIKEFLDNLGVITFLACTAATVFIAIGQEMEEQAERAELESRIYNTTVVKTIASSTDKNLWGKPQRHLYIGLNVDDNPYNDPDIDENPLTPEFYLLAKDEYSDDPHDASYVLSKLEPGDEVVLTGQPDRPFYEDTNLPRLAYGGKHGRNIVNLDEIMDKHGTYQATVTGIKPMPNKKGEIFPAVEFTTQDGVKYTILDYRYQFREGDNAEIRDFLKPMPGRSSQLDSYEMFTDATMRMLGNRRASLSHRERLSEIREFKNGLFAAARLSGTQERE
jgi:hypothetical protein